MFKNKKCKNVNNEKKRRTITKEEIISHFARERRHTLHICLRNPWWSCSGDFFLSLIRRSRIKEQRVGAHLWYACVRVYILYRDVFFRINYRLIMRHKIFVRKKLWNLKLIQWNAAQTKKIQWNAVIYLFYRNFLRSLFFVFTKIQKC